MRNLCSRRGPRIALAAAVLAVAVVAAALPAGAGARADRHSRANRALSHDRRVARPTAVQRDRRGGPAHRTRPAGYCPVWVRPSILWPRLGTFVTYLPAPWAVVRVGPYWYDCASGVCYSAVPGGWVVASQPCWSPCTPCCAAAARGAGLLPRLTAASGQDAAQQARDRYACHVWAVAESGYDPLGGGTASEVLQAAYRDAVIACMEARGYRVEEEDDPAD